MLEEEHGHAGDATFEAEMETEGEEEWLALAEHGQVRAALVEYVRMRNEVTFQQLVEDFSPFIETAGDQGLALRGDPNVVLWYGIPKELASTLAKLVSARKLLCILRRTSTCVPRWLLGSCRCWIGCPANGQRDRCGCRW